jgi:hypothetical protein
MTEEVGAGGFVRTYNFRRILAKATCMALVVFVVAREIPQAANWMKVVDSGIALIAVAAAFVVVNFFYCKCPRCKRHIGIRPMIAGRLPRGTPCEMESKHIARLNWPE